MKKIFYGLVALYLASCGPQVEKKSDSTMTDDVFKSYIYENTRGSFWSGVFSDINSQMRANGEDFSPEFYRQFDSLVNLYENDKKISAVNKEKVSTWTMVEAASKNRNNSSYFDSRYFSDGGKFLSTVSNLKERKIEEKNKDDISLLESRVNRIIDLGLKIRNHPLYSHLITTGNSFNYNDFEDEKTKDRLKSLNEKISSFQADVDTMNIIDRLYDKFKSQPLNSSKYDSFCNYISSNVNSINLANEVVPIVKEIEDEYTLYGKLIPQCVKDIKSKLFAFSQGKEYKKPKIVERVTTPAKKQESTNTTPPAAKIEEKKVVPNTQPNTTDQKNLFF